MKPLTTQVYYSRTVANVAHRASAGRPATSSSQGAPTVQEQVEAFVPQATRLPRSLELSPAPNVAGSFALADSQTGAIVCRSPEQLRDRAKRFSRNGTTVIAVRHGESHSNKAAILSGSENTPLNEKGQNQARDAAKTILAASDFEPQDLVILTSPLSRAKDTALEPQKLVLQAPLHVTPDLAEINFGQREGLPISEVATAYPNFASGHDFAHRFPQGESGLDVMERVDRFLSQVENDYPDKTVVYFGHSMTVAMGRLLLGQSAVGDDGKVVFDKKTPNAVPEVLVRAEKPAEELGLLLAR